ncbi:uncharacterized protein LACBIDRAFT_302768 [Laccaria bicolor S238N-H82]|uniref:Predicted protein n=1 Tax=Laccaria bicolor (strain S238N-H82 / ATCC MYA-4686) TaxID=486041 RepID=B0DI93_LACBS|nr:uncharacterized protein LACBIDRAFT_302768 [Laccaria bicolor S238N-H82]EDR05642.1 predicted protein [Laccaria bicolor S238N-H82]|eukprot:XP_001883746.1 predicted protein [Laccaria bicolor S238N-H82]
MPIQEDDWSDSDDEQLLGEVETSVLLGVPDGPIDTPSDIDDAAVSRIGGHPAFLPSREPPFSSSHCNLCSNPMELLVQMWCPFEDSPMDRALYIWGCPRTGCQGKDGSIRAWRGLRFNAKYAAKLEQKLARKREREKAKADALAAETARKQAVVKSNPFSMSNVAPSNHSVFGFGAQVFGNVDVPTPESELKSTKADVPPDEDEGTSDTESDSGSEKSLLTAMASTSMDESPWKSAPSYRPLYLSTASEYLPPLPKPKIPAGAQIVDPDEEGKGGKDTSWTSEAYENSLNVDNVFERFTERVGYEGEQCVRYELRGTPLPFSSDKVFETLFPTPPAPSLPVTRAVYTVVPPLKRVYNSSTVPVCPVCKSKRVFECQLTPNLINVLRSPEEEKPKKVSDEERRKAVERALKGEGKDEKRGMEWGTCFIFSCEKDCCCNDDGWEDKECWREEKVLVQWDV